MTKRGRPNADPRSVKTGSRPKAGKRPKAGSRPKRGTPSRARGARPATLRTVAELRNVAALRIAAARDFGRRHRRALSAVAAITVYGLVALAANLPSWPGDPSHIRPGDNDVTAWFLAWTPYAVEHGHSPFFTDWLNYPNGVNLAQNNPTVLLGVLAAPLTLAVSPLATINLLLWLSFVLSGAAMFFVLRRFVTSDVAAFIGGALYAFSPYLVDQDLTHLNLAFVPLPPLILLAAYETIRPQQPRAVRWGAWLGVLIAAQFFISAEIDFTCVLVAVIGVAIAAIAHPGQIAPTVLRAGPALLLGAAIVAVCAAYPLWATAAGPYRYQGAAFRRDLNADLLSLITPTFVQRLAPSGLASVGNKLIAGDWSENDVYLGVPMLILIVVILVRYRRVRWVRFGAAMVLVTAVLALGPHVVVDNHRTGVPMPMWLIEKLPLANNLFPCRLSLYTDMFAAFVVALGIDQLRGTALARPPGGPPSRRRRWSIRGEGVGDRVAVYGLLLLSIAALVPSWPIRTGSSTRPAHVPAYFSSAAVNGVKPGGVALISPYPSIAEVAPMLWQAVAAMRFRMIGGYALFRGPGGTSATLPAILDPSDVEGYLWSGATGGAPYSTEPLPRLYERLVCDTRVFLRRNHVSAVLDTSVARYPRYIRFLFSEALGPPSATTGGVAAWYDVQSLVASTSQRCRNLAANPPA